MQENSNTEIKSVSYHRLGLFHCLSFLRCLGRNTFCPDLCSQVKLDEVTPLAELHKAFFNVEKKKEKKIWIFRNSIPVYLTFANSVRW